MQELSFVGGSPEIRFPFLSSLEIEFGSMLPIEQPVGVINQPSPVRTLIFPELPKVSPLSKSDLVIPTIRSRVLVSFIIQSQIF